MKFDQFGCVINVNVKTERPRYIRIVAGLPYLAAWKSDYPFEPEGNALVFVTEGHLPLQYQTVTAQVKKIARRAGITKRVTMHLFRHSRITHLVRQGVPESIVKAMGWGNQKYKCLKPTVTSQTLILTT